MLILRLFSRQWWWSTLLVLAAMGVMLRLGIWQLERLEQRRAFNARVLAGQNAPPLELTQATLTDPLEDMEYRTVTVTGEYDVEHQVALRNRVWYGKPGYDLLTPLKIAGTDMAILVNRGWVPVSFIPGGEQTYPAPGVVTLTGIIRLSQSAPDFGGSGAVTPRADEILTVVSLVNVEAIAAQLPYPILPVYIQRAPDASLPADVNAWTDQHLPYPGLPEIEISEGPHLGYALQWFTFALILGLGYPVFIVRQKETK
ncbi:MAG: SURF1 family protein [Anaerolineales bacterium]